MWKQANQLQINDIIAAPDSSQHRVTAIEHHGLAGAWLTIHTNTGLALTKTQDEAKLDTYNVVGQLTSAGVQVQ
jgi:hypothetical protein